MTTLVALSLILTQTPLAKIPYSNGMLKVQKLASLEFPWGMTELPDGRVLITEKPGRLRIFKDGQLSSPVSGVPKVAYREQGGLLDVEQDPDFAQNQMVYLYFAEPAKVQNGKPDRWDHRFGAKPNKPLDSVLKGGAVAKAKLVGNSLQNLRVIWRQHPKEIGRGHFGGRLIFDHKGHLFITSGERMRFDPAQDMSMNLGKIIRINEDGSIPKDNPWPGKDIWTLGHRNPLGGAFEPSTGKLWVCEMGPMGGDEINLILPKHNYGWPIVSNGDNYDRSPIPDHDTRPEFAKPAIYWNPVISPSGMIFYTGDMFPKWKGNIFLGGLSSQSLIRVSVKNGVLKEEERIGFHRRIRDVMQASDGSIWLLTDAKMGALLRVTP
jgi:glucose/arabinose dehydrogenase